MSDTQNESCKSEFLKFLERDEREMMHSELEKVVKEEIKQKLASSVIRKKILSSSQIESDISQNKLLPLTDVSNIDKDY